MFYNIHHDSYNDFIHLWEYKDGKKCYVQEKWVPYVFIPVAVETGIKTIDGNNVLKKEFDSNKDYNKFQNGNVCYENNILACTQFLAERFHHEKTINLPPLHIASIDIETPSNEGFPTVEDTPAPVVLISIVDEKDIITIFGIGAYGNKNNKKCKYYSCKDEKDLLNKFFIWMQRQEFDVITGWNIVSDNKMNPNGGFDIPYLIRRSIALFGEKTNIYKKLSPINNVRIWKNANYLGIYNVSIAGVYLIDYLSLYKWFSTNNMESYKLGYVAETEKLNTQKIKWHEKYDTMWEFYKNDWDWFVDYCIDDSIIPMELEKKLGYLMLAQTLSLYCCTTMNNYNSSTGLIEGLMLKYFRNNNLCAPILYGGSQEWFPAAYVKEPIKGLHQDEIDLDITSSYPTHMIIQNMSLETYFGRIVGFHDNDIDHFRDDTGIHECLHDGRPIYKMVIEYNRDREYPDFFLLNNSGNFIKYSGDKLKKFNSALEKGLLSISPCGSVFFNKPKGLMATVVKTTFLERKEQNRLKNEYKKMIEGCKSDQERQILKEKVANKHALQWALKVLINSFFGVTGVPYSRYFNVNISEAITSGGRHTIQMGEVFVDDLLNSPDKGLLELVSEIKRVCEPS